MLEEEIIRRAKAEALRQAGVDPYPANAHRTDEIGSVIGHFDDLAAKGTVVTVAGRLRSIRNQGGAAFADLTDASGKIQLHLKSDILGEDNFKLFVDDIDHADFIEAQGTLFLTKRGQQSIEVKSWRLLAKALLPLPEKWHGLSDVETRYRQRHLDLLSNPEVFEIFRKRSLIVQQIRNVLTREGFMEVETPILQTVAGGAAAKPFVTHHNTLGLDLYLRIAPELFLKRLIVGGYEKVFEVARCFRNEGISFQHNPEFTQVEFYWAYANYEDLMALTERMMTEIVSAETGGRLTIERDGATLDFKAPYPRRKFYDLVKEHTGIDLALTPGETELRAQIQLRKLDLDVSAAVGYGEICDRLYKEYVRPNIVQPTFVLDYPAAMIPLAKRKAPPEDDRIATVQLVVQGMEITKAYNELNDPLEQQARFTEEDRKKGKGSEEAMAADLEFVEALKHGMPPTAGFGMGIDRLTAILTGAHSVKEVILFPTMRPEAKTPEAP